MNKLKLNDNITSSLGRAPKGSVNDKSSFCGRFIGELERKGKIIKTFEFPNLVVTEGQNKILDVQFRNATQIANWYLGLIDGAGSPVIAVTDTMAQIGGTNGWDELTSYDESGRQQWSPAAPASGQLSNSSPVVFTMNATDIIYGVFLCSASSGTTGTLWSAAQLGSALNVVDDDIFRATYVVDAS